MTGGNPDWVFGELAEYLEDRHARRNDNTYKHVGEIGDTKVRKSVTHQKAAHDRLAEQGELPDDVPADYYETRTARDVRPIEGTETASRAVAHDDAATLRSMVGAPEKSTDLSYQEPIRQVIQLLDERPTPMMYVAGPPGTGKTYLAKWFVELWRDNVAPNGIVASNLRTLQPPEHHEDDRHGHVAGFADLVEWVEQDSTDDHYSDDGVAPKAILIDEASSALVGSGKTGYDVRQYVAPMLFKIREHVTNNGLVIWIGHDSGDVHPIFRALALYVEKLNEKDWTVYETVRNRSGVDEIGSYTGTPPGNWQVGEFEKPSFELDPTSDDGDGEDGAGDGAESVDAETRRRDALAINAVTVKQQTGKANDDIAADDLNDARSGEWVRQRWKDYKSGELTEWLSPHGREMLDAFGL